MIRQFRQFEKSYDDFNYFSMMNHVKKMLASLDFRS